MKRRQFLQAIAASTLAPLVASSSGCLVAPAVAGESPEFTVDDFKAFDDYVQELLKSVARGLGVPYERLSDEYAEMAEFRRPDYQLLFKKGTSQSLPAYGA